MYENNTIIYIFRDSDDEDLRTQLDVFDNRYANDEEELFNRVDVETSTSNHASLFNALYGKVIQIAFESN